jgi:hypothetical protein
VRQLEDARCEGGQRPPDEDDGTHCREMNLNCEVKSVSDRVITDAVIFTGCARGFFSWFF